MAGDESEMKHEPVTISAPPESVTVDPQNPLPEPSFFYRRILAYLVVISVLALTAYAADALHDLGAFDNLLTLTQWALGFAALVATYYYVAPSAAELAQIIQSARIIKSGIGMASDRAQARRKQGKERDSGSPEYPSSLGPQNRSEGPDSGDYAPRGNYD